MATNLMVSILMCWATTMLMMTMLMNKKLFSIMTEWKIMQMEGNSMTFNLIMDWKATFFMFTVAAISAAILQYSKFYMPDNHKNKFSKIVLTFVLSMMMLIVSPNMISMVMGWEGLGMSSFILIIFFANKKSMMSGIFTMVMNRLGDIMIMLTMMYIMNANSWMLTSMIMYKSTTVATIACLGLFSKSAQIPFSSWLTEAMAAPTPVSALVHSSTLVTAGVYVMIRLEMSFKWSSTNKMILVMTAATIMMASMNALLEWDIKKMVALSTLSQLSTMFLSISINMYTMATFHMFMHAMFKALLFMSSSTMISMANSQDIRKITSSSQMMMNTKIGFTTATLALSGMMFMSGFYSKEIIVEMMELSPTNQTCMMVMLTATCITMVYSMKLIVFTQNKMNKTTMKMTKETSNQTKSNTMLTIPSVILGNKMNWIINMNNSIPYLTKTEKTAPVIILLMSMIMMEEINKTNQMNKTKKLKMMSNYMWFMKNFSVPTKMMILNMMMKMNKISETGKMSQTATTMINKFTKITNTKFLITNKHMKLITMTMLVMMIVFT